MGRVSPGVVGLSSEPLAGRVCGQGLPCPVLGAGLSGFNPVGSGPVGLRGGHLSVELTLCPAPTPNRQGFLAKHSPATFRFAGVGAVWLAVAFGGRARGVLALPDTASAGYAAVASLPTAVSRSGRVDHFGIVARSVGQPLSRAGSRAGHAVDFEPLPVCRGGAHGDLSTRVLRRQSGKLDSARRAVGVSGGVCSRVVQSGDGVSGDALRAVVGNRQLCGVGGWMVRGLAQPSGVEPGLARGTRGRVAVVGERAVFAGTRAGRSDGRSALAVARHLLRGPDADHASLLPGTLRPVLDSGGPGRAADDAVAQRAGGSPSGPDLEVRMKFADKEFLRSVPGQLLLLAGTFLGAIILAVAAILLRGVMFEPYVREKYPAVDAETQKFIEGLVEGHSRIETLEKLIDREADRLAQRRRPASNADRLALAKRERPEAVKNVLSACYGYWMTHRTSEKEDRILAALARQSEQELPDLLRRTLVVGNLRQKLLALEGVKWLNLRNPRPADLLLDYARNQALHRRDSEIIAKCDQILTAVKRE